MAKAERKDRLVQTRVPGDLDDTLREAAKQKRVTVSQLIRNVLEDTFNLVDDVVASSVSLGQTVRRDAQRIAESAQGRGRARPDDALRQVVAWQEVTANRDAACARCARTLGRGEKSMLGLSSDPRAPRVWLCLSCAAKR
jgi:hypothetical protein